MRTLDIVETQPDLQVILGDNRANLKGTHMDGPADICIEVVSPGSVAVDYGAKLEEYERGGVGEYWIVDPVRQAAHFHRLTGGVYRYFSAEADGCYRTPALPRFRLHVPTLWQTPLPDIVQTVELARAMLAEG